MAIVAQLLVMVTAESESSILPMVTAISATVIQLLPMDKRRSIKSGPHTTNMLKTTAKVSTAKNFIRLGMAALQVIIMQTTALPHLTALQPTVPTTPIRVTLKMLMLALKP